MKPCNLIGQRFGKLIVISKSKIKKYGVYLWECRCDCGNITYVSSNSLNSGNTKSCGCYKYSGLYHPKHKGYKTHLYFVWESMKKRCYNSNDKFYYCYGDVGIKVCDEWRNDFSSFRDWAVRNGYNEEKLASGINKLTLDRIDVNGNYCPQNCRWVDMSIQNNNKRNIRKYYYNGETHTITEWSKIKNISFMTLYDRLNKLHWSIDRALNDNTTIEKGEKDEQERNC